MAEEDWSGLPEAELQEKIIKLTQEIASVEVKAGDGLEDAGVDSMDAAGIQKKLVKHLPGYNIPEDALVFMSEDAKTIEDFMLWLKDKKK
mmetsp:Transcript_67719/g.153148  ORF Transcript_67719/g.153148 Transcript_67719/m.153148 type:complete len:90 (+) Transcript_67719:101-370(+)